MVWQIISKQQDDVAGETGIYSNIYTSKKILSIYELIICSAQHSFNDVFHEY